MKRPVYETGVAFQHIELYGAPVVFPFAVTICRLNVLTIPLSKGRSTITARKCVSLKVCIHLKDYKLWLRKAMRYK